VTSVQGPDDEDAPSTSHVGAMALEEAVQVTVVEWAIADTVSELAFAAYTVSVDESTATPMGSDPTSIVAVTVFVAPSITDTV